MLSLPCVSNTKLHCCVVFQVFPCCYDRVVGKYRAMYNTVEAEDVHFEKPPSSAQDVGDVDFEKPNSNGQDIEVRVEKPTYENRYA